MRRGDIHSFEKGGPFLDCSNYAFGEGGAGTFSDGKLTSPYQEYFPGEGVCPSQVCDVWRSGGDSVDGSSPYRER